MMTVMILAGQGMSAEAAHSWNTAALISQGTFRRSGERKNSMAITVNLRYTGKDGNARRFAEEMISGGTADAIRAEKGNLRYEYYQPLADPETILLIDSWEDQAAIDAHHSSPMMERISMLREKYDLHMTAERFVSAETPETEDRFIRK